MSFFIQMKQTFLRNYYRRSYWFQRLPISQRILVVILPMISIVGLMMFYFSFQPPQVIPVVTENPVEVEFFVMSRCPDARKCQSIFTPILLELSSIVNFTLSFIAYSKGENQIECMHGEDECLGNKQQLCVQHLTTQENFIRFLQCQTKDFLNIPENAQRCVEQLADQRLKWSQVNQCVQSSQGQNLFFQSLKRTRTAGATKSCTMYLNGKFWCMHDGSWVGCSEGHDEKSFIKAICLRYNGKNKPSQCNTGN